MMYDPMIIWAEGGEWRWWNWNFNLDNSSNELLIVLEKKQQIPFFYQGKPSDLSAALRWRMDGSKVLHDASSLQNNVTLIAKESVWWGKVRAVGAVPGVIFGLSCPLKGDMPSHSAAPAAHV